MEPPSFKYLRPENFNKLDDKQLESIENLTRFHIDSFDWMIDQGLLHAIKVNRKNTNKKAHFFELFKRWFKPEFFYDFREYHPSSFSWKTAQKSPTK